MSERLIASEAQTQKAILDWLRAERILAFRLNVGVHEVNGRVIRYGVPGMADILAFPKMLSVQNWNSILPAPIEFHEFSLPLWIEVKALKGKQSELQKSFQRQVEIHGHRYVLARSLEDVQEALK